MKEEKAVCMSETEGEDGIDKAISWSVSLLTPMTLSLRAYSGFSVPAQRAASLTKSSGGILF